MTGLTRRELLGVTVGAAVLSGSAGAIEPPVRVGGPHLRVGCCAYSYRDHLQGKKQPAMTLDDFLNRVAEIGIDGVELTSYYFPQDVTAASIHNLARRCFQLRLDVHGTAIGNTFTLPPGEKR